MRRIYFLLCLVAAFPAVTNAQGLSGAWSGKLDGRITLIFHFLSAPGGGVTGTIDSPDQNAIGLPIATVITNKDSVTCILNAPSARYEAVRVNDTTLKGLFLQGPAKIPLEVHKISGVAAMAAAPLHRPQTPFPPFPYNSDSVTYFNLDHSIHFGATLTYPKKGRAFPAAVLITGSGQQDRDETLLGHKPFAVIADYLTRRGYAVLRVDDRGTGLTTGDVISATSADFARDVEAGIAYLKTRKEIDAAKIGLIGHSEGAMIAPMIAARNKEVAFIILLASPVVGGYATLMYQSMEPFRLKGASPEYLQLASHLEGIALNNSIRAADTASFVNGFMTQYKAWADSIPDTVKAKYPDFFSSPDQLKKIYAKAARIFVSPWWKFFMTYPSVNDFSHLKIPVLALNGEKDIQVECKSNLDLINKTLTAADNTHFETRAIPGLNHLFQHCHTCLSAEYAQLEETFAPEALQVMGDWLDVQVRH